MLHTHHELQRLALQRQQDLLADSARHRLARQAHRAQGTSRPSIRHQLAALLHTLATHIDDPEPVSPRPEPLLQW